MNGFAGMTRSVRFVILMGAAVLLCRTAPAQVDATAMQSSFHATFDVVSIRPMKEDDSTPTHIFNSSRNGSIKAVNVNLKALLEVAYDMPDLRMFGGPAWLTADKFSLEAKADPKLDEQLASLPAEQAKQLKRTMLTTLLAERFHVAVHTETREMAIYAMVVVKGGPKLNGNKPGDDFAPKGNDRIQVRAGSDSLQVLAYELSWRLGRPVVDRTGVQDRQALVLTWRDDEQTTADASGPSLFTAIQEQLGLKLESTRGLVPVLMIDHAERPTEN